MVTAIDTTCGAPISGNVDWVAADLRNFRQEFAEHVERTNSIMDNLTAPRENLKFTRARDVIIADSVIISLAYNNVN